MIVAETLAVGHGRYLMECGDSSADSGEIQPETRLVPKSRVSLITNIFIH
jgi:hypothetical protein